MTKHISELAKLEEPCICKNGLVAGDCDCTGKIEQHIIGCKTCKGTGIQPKYPWLRVMIKGKIFPNGDPLWRDAELGEISLWTVVMAYRELRHYDVQREAMKQVLLGGMWNDDSERQVTEDAIAALWAAETEEAK